MNEEKNPAVLLKERTRKVNMILALVLPVLLVLVLAVGLLVKDRSYSAKENRSLQSFPSVDIRQIGAGNTQDAMERYASDQLLLRDYWLELERMVSTVIGGRESAGIYEGSGGFLIKRFAEPDQELLERQKQAVRKLASQNDDVDVYVAVAPTAAEILKNRLPSGAPNADQAAYIEKWQTGLGERVTSIDVSKILRNHKDEYIYYRTDSSWTSLGAYYAYKELAAHMGLDLGADSYEAIPVSDSFSGDLAAAAGRGTRGNDTITAYFYIDSTFRQIVEYTEEQEKSASVYDSRALETANQLDVFLRGNHPLVKINSTSASSEKLLILKDTYANSLVPFMVSNYQKIVLVDPRYYYGDINELIRDEKITDVLILYNADTLSADTALASVLEEANE